MIDAERISALFEAAAFEPGGLADACERAAPLADSHIFYLVGHGGEQPAFVGGPASRQRADLYHAGEWWRIDEITSAARTYGDTRLRFDHEIVPADVRKRSAFFNDFLYPEDIPFCAGWSFSMGGERWGFAAMRGVRQGPYAEEDRSAFERIVPIAMRAAQLAAQLEHVRSRSLIDGLDLAGAAAIVLDHRGSCAFVTRAAEKLFGPGFGPRAGLLWAADRGAGAGLAQLAAVAGGRVALPLRKVLVPRGEGRRPILILPLTVRGAGLDVLPGGRVVLILIDLDARPEPKPRLLREIFGLTAAEAQVAQRLAAGLSPEEITEELGIRISTTRQHMKSIFTKTECHRQAELVALLASVPAAGDDPGG